eukprot:g53819.t1
MQRATIEQLLKAGPTLLQDVDSQLEFARHVLEERLTSGLEEADVRSLLHLLATFSSPRPQVTEALLNCLAVAPPGTALLIIDALPHIAGSSHEEALLILEAYEDLLRSNRSFLVPIIGSLPEMEMQPDVRKHVFQLAVESLGTLEEADFPTALRTLLHSADWARDEEAGQCMAAIRRHARTLSAHCLGLMLEVLAGAWRQRPAAAHVWLQTLEQQPQPCPRPAAQSSDLSVFDLLACLLYLANPASVSAAPALQVGWPFAVPSSNSSSAGSTAQLDTEDSWTARVVRLLLLAGDCPRHICRAGTGCRQPLLSAKLIQETLQLAAQQELVAPYSSCFLRLSKALLVGVPALSDGAGAADRARFQLQVAWWSALFLHAEALRSDLVRMLVAAVAYRPSSAKPSQLAQPACALAAQLLLALADAVPQALLPYAGFLESLLQYPASLAPRSLHLLAATLAALAANPAHQDAGERAALAGRLTLFVSKALLGVVGNLCCAGLAVASQLLVRRVGSHQDTAMLLQSALRLLPTLFLPSHTATRPAGVAGDNAQVCEALLSFLHFVSPVLSPPLLQLLAKELWKLLLRLKLVRQTNSTSKARTDSEQGSFLHIPWPAGTLPLDSLSRSGSKAERGETDRPYELHLAALSAHANRTRPTHLWSAIFLHHH